MASGRGCPSGPSTPGRPELVGVGAASGSREKTRLHPVQPEGGRVYTPIDGEAKMEIPVNMR